uniref:Uncharacterized protein n=1 Tax=Panagrolaimus davidi TaxID=227884 RepID=A0A914QSB4_9BILA
MIVMTAALIGTTGGPPPGGPPGDPPMASASNSWRVVQPPTTSSYYNPHTAPPFTVPQPTFAYAPYGYVTSTGSYVYTPMASPYYVSTPTTAATTEVSSHIAPPPSTTSCAPPTSTNSGALIVSDQTASDANKNCSLSPSRDLLLPIQAVNLQPSGSQVDEPPSQHTPNCEATTPTTGPRTFATAVQPNTTNETTAPTSSSGKTLFSD